MFHATDRDNVESILDNGFRPSTSGMLGPGLYVSRDINKTKNYGEVCFKLLVYIGMAKTVDAADKDGSWRMKGYDCAFLPPQNNLIPTKMEETCVKSVKHVKILGIAYGYQSSMPKCLRDQVRNLKGTGHKLDEEEKRVLNKMVREIGTDP